MNHEEQDQQALFFGYLRILVANGELPERIFKLTTATANGGKRSIITGAMLKRTGVKRGIPDIYCDVPRKGYHGLRIELKRKKEKGRKTPAVTQEQKEILRLLNEEGYFATVCYGHKEALAVYIDYIGISSQSIQLL